MAVDLDQKKLSLCEALKDKTPQYWDLMKSWYKQKITKDDFDKKAKSLLGESDIHLHNDFLFSLLIKCHTVSSLHGDHVSPQQYSTVMGATGRPGEDKGLKRPKLDPTPITNITPYGVFNETRYLTGEQYHTAMMCGKDLDRILMCSHELLLPDLPTLHTRLLLIAWEYGMDGVTEDSALYLIKALEMFLKSVLEACIMCKTHRKIKSDAVTNAVGSVVDSRDTADNLINSNNRVLAIETLEAQQTANIPNSRFQTSSAITSYNLRDAIKTYGSSCIPSFPVRAMIMEKVLATIWHPNVSDLSNTDCIKQWKRNLMK